MACDQGNEVERTSDHVVRIPELEDTGIACVEIQPGDTIVLPFDLSTSDISDEMAVRARLLDDALVIQQDEGAIILLDGYARALDVGEVVVSGIRGTPIDAVLWLAVTDPNLIIQ